jgi:hypothetical protein
MSFHLVAREKPMAQNQSVWKRVLNSTKSTQNTWPYIGPTLAICGALLWGTAMVYASMYARLPAPSPNVKTWVIGLGAVAGVFIASGAFGSAKRHVLLWPPIFLGGLLAGGFLVWHFGVGGVTRMGEQAQQAFVDERHDFATSPAGFPYLANTARDVWAVDMELDDATSASPAVDAGDLDGSPASSQVHRGFCVVSLAPRMTARFVGAAEAVEYRQDLWWVAVAREVGRCVDVSRDESPDATSRGSFKSLAPADAFGISTSHDYFLATKKASTRQWRERYADAFAVGWMRLVKQDYSRQLADNLRHDQELASSDDAAPEAGCAIVAALKARSPGSLSELPAWADRIRSEGCPH